MVRTGDKGVATLSVVSAAERPQILPAVDKLVMMSNNELHIIYTHKSPVSIWSDNPVALYEYLQTSTPLRYTEFERAMVTDLEETQAA